MSKVSLMVVDQDNATLQRALTDQDEVVNLNPGSGFAKKLITTVPVGASLPAASVQYRGTLAVVLEGDRDADCLKICLKDQNGLYAWALVVTGYVED